jgi:hypothetical protein
MNDKCHFQGFFLTKQGFEYIRRNLKKQTRLKASGGKKMSALVYVYTLIVYLPV